MAEAVLHSVEELKITQFTETDDKKRVQKSAIQIVRFFIEDFEFALDIMDIKEIKEMEQIRNLPNCKQFVRGLFNLRGDIIPILDLKKKLEFENIEISKLARMGEEKPELLKNAKQVKKEEAVNEIATPAAPAEDTTAIPGLSGDSVFKADENQDTRHIIICKVKSEVFGVIVDRIARVQYLYDEDFEPVPKLISFIGEQFIKGFAKVDNKILVVLSLENLFYAQGASGK